MENLETEKVYRNRAAADEALRPTVSVIYVNYHTAPLLIDSIRTFDRVDPELSFEIIIVDNASSGDDLDLLRSFSSGSQIPIRIVESGRNAGFAAANNIGAGLSSAPYLFFLNPDTLLVNDAPGILYRFMEGAERKVAACGASLLRNDGLPNHSYGNFPGLLQEVCHIGLGLSALLGNIYRYRIAIGSEVHFDQVREVDYIVGADIFIRASDLGEAGGFDESYFMYYEETDLFKRLNLSGKSACIIPEAKIVHLEGGSFEKGSEEFNYRRFGIILESKLRYYRKWHPDKLPTILKLIRMQIYVQCLKGNWGADRGRLSRLLDDILPKTSGRP